MLTGFETETKPLTEDEKALIPLLVKGFFHHVGKENAIKEFTISEKLKKGGFKLNGARFRKLVNHIRVNKLTPGYALLSSSEGYWLSDDVNEVKQCADSLQERAKAILHVSEAIYLMYGELKYKKQA